MKGIFNRSEAEIAEQDDENVEASDSDIELFLQAQGIVKTPKYGALCLRLLLGLYCLIHSFI